MDEEAVLLDQDLVLLLERLDEDPAAITLILPSIQAQYQPNGGKAVLGQGGDRPLRRE